MHVIVSVVIWLFAAIVVIGGFGFVLLDAMDKVESIQKRAPWIINILERRGALVVLLMICAVLLIGDGYELLTKEVPEIPNAPIIKLVGPDPARDAQVVQLQRRVSDLQSALVKHGGPHSPANATSPPEARRCLMTNHYEEPNHNVQVAIIATTAIIRCNYRVDAPLIVGVEFDTADFVSGTLFLPDEGSVIGAGTQQQGKWFYGQIQSPSVPANDVITVTVQGTTKQPPKAVRALVQSK